MTESIHPPLSAPHGTRLRKLAMAAGALLLFATIVAALHAIVGDLAIATMVAGLGAITVAPLFGGRA